MQLTCKSTSEVFRFLLTRMLESSGLIYSFVFSLYSYFCDKKKTKPHVMYAAQFEFSEL